MVSNIQEVILMCDSGYSFPGSICPGLSGGSSLLSKPGGGGKEGGGAGGNRGGVGSGGVGEGRGGGGGRGVGESRGAGGDCGGGWLLSNDITGQDPHSWMSCISSYMHGCMSSRTD